ncbi:unnamed protein product [Mesocestoides corti]|uniref:AD domain-containing protein n=1 Tax=Mesocestoides corti TaxID=53468 RepID=A0A0R3UF35_MESCO|nr:unnamed protein product [Mesocestoides corti]
MEGGVEESNLPPLWTALKVSCCNSKEFVGYLCGATNRADRRLVLCSVPSDSVQCENGPKLFIVSGWSIEKIEVLDNYPPIPEETKALLDNIYSSAIDRVTDKTTVQGADHIEMRRQAVLRFFGPCVAKPADGTDGKIVLYDGVVSISPPYLPSSCHSSNQIALQRVQNLLQQVDDKPS